MNALKATLFTVLAFAALGAAVINPYVDPISPTFAGTVTAGEIRTPLDGGVYADTANAYGFVPAATGYGPIITSVSPVGVIIDSDNNESGSAAFNILADSADPLAATTMLSVRDDGRILGAARPNAIKTTGETVTSSTALQSDDHLSVTIREGYNYGIELLLSLTSPAAADFRLAFTTSNVAAVTGGLLCTFSDTGGATVVTKAHSSLGNQQLYSTNGAGLARCWGYAQGVDCTTGSTCTLTLQWAQGTSDPGATTVFAGSHLKLERF